ncbi:hypothetical protein AAMO2058_001663300 [Amorphochlora amoebiformis]
MEQTSSHKRVSSRIFSSSCGNQSSRKGSRKERATDGRVGQIQYKARPPPPGVKPIKIYSERDLAAEMQKINETLECVKDVSWKARLTALDRLGGLVLGGAHELINFTPLFKRMKESLIKQLQSLRSKVVKHACKVLAYISSTLRNQFENLMEFLIPALANLNNSSKQVFSDSANDCMETLLISTRCPRRAIGQMLETCESKVPAVRAKSMDYLAILLQDNSPTDLFKHLFDIQVVLKNRLSDAAGNVRSAARTVFAALKSRYPAQADQLAADLDPKTLRLLTTGASSGTLSSAVHESKRRDTKLTSKSILNVKLGNTWPGKKPDSSSKKPQQFSAYSSNTLGPPGTYGPPTEAVHAPSLGPPIAPAAGKGPQNSSRLGGAKRTFKQINDENKRPAKLLTTLHGSAIRVLPHHELNEGDKTKDEIHEMSPQSPPPIPPRLNQKRVSQKSSVQVRVQQAATKHLSHPESNSKILRHALEDAQAASGWAERVQTLEAFSKSLVDSRGSILHRMAGKMVSLLEKRLPDPHQKVAGAALYATPRIAASLGSELSLYLDRLLPRLLPRLLDHKPQHHKLAKAALNAVFEQVGVAALPTLVRMTSSQMPQERHAAFITLSSVAASYASYFHVQTNMSASILGATRCLKTARRAINPLRKPAINLLKVLQSTFPSHFEDVVSSLHESDRTIVVSISNKTNHSSTARKYRKPETKHHKTTSSSKSVSKTSDHVNLKPDTSSKEPAVVLRDTGGDVVESQETPMELERAPVQVELVDQPSISVLVWSNLKPMLEVGGETAASTLRAVNKALLNQATSMDVWLPTLKHIVLAVDTDLSLGETKCMKAHSYQVTKQGLSVLAVMVAKMDIQTLEIELRSLSPALVRWLNHSSVVVRRSVVRCFVSIHNILGVEILDDIKGLNKSQKKLIQVYAAKSARSQMNVRMPLREVRGYN